MKIEYPKILVLFEYVLGLINSFFIFVCYQMMDFCFELQEVDISQSSERAFFVFILFSDGISRGDLIVGPYSILKSVKFHFWCPRSKENVVLKTIWLQSVSLSGLSIFWAVFSFSSFQRNLFLKPTSHSCLFPPTI